MFIEILEYIGVLAIVLTAIVSYNQYKAGKFSKDYVEVEDDTKKQSRFKKWWNQSYIRDIYIVRASQRKLICFVPWLGVWISLFFVFWFLSALITETLHPLQPMEKLKKYEGVIINYFYHKKSDSVLQIRLKNGTIKNFHVFIQGMNIKERYVGKEVVVLVQKDWGVFDLGYFEKIVWIESDNNPLNTIYKTYAEKYNNKLNINSNVWLPNLLLSLKWLIGSLALLWFINRKPLITINEINKKD